MVGMGVGSAVGVAPGAGALFWPPSSLIMNLDARYDVSVDTGADAWDSQEPASGPSAVQATPGQQPAYDGAVVKFDATDDNMVVGSWATEARCLHDGTGATLVAHLRLTSISNVRYLVWNTISTSGVGFRLYYTISGSEFRAEVSNGSGTLVASAQTDSGSFPVVAGRTYTFAISISDSAVRMLVRDNAGNLADVSDSFGLTPNTGDAAASLTLGRNGTAPGAMNLAALAIWSQVYPNLDQLISAVRFKHGISLPA